MKRAPIVWEGPRAPTRCELRAIGQAYRRGELVDGDRVAPAVVRSNPSPAEEAYTEFHWGREPQEARKVDVPHAPEVFELGALRAVEYETKKGDTAAIWVHRFGRPFPTLTATPGGRLGPIVGGGARVTKKGIVG